MDNFNDRVPRYKKPGFKAIRTPNNTGMIKGYLGAKLFNGVYKIPEQVEITFDEFKRIAKAQALADYNGMKGTNPEVKAEMRKIYGVYYTKEFENLKNANNGPSATRMPLPKWSK